MKNPILEAKEVYKSYREGQGRLDVLSGVNMSLQEGEIVALMGDSGAGKTTLLNLLGSLDKPDQGSIVFKETDITRLKDNQLAEFRGRHIGFLFQFHYLLSDFTARENIMMPGLVIGSPRGELEKEADFLLEKVGLSGRAGHHPAELSGGEQQRVAMLRALMNNPLVVLADEPAGNLDERNSKQLLDLMFSLREEKGQSFLVATHNKQLAARCDRSIHLKAGTLSDSL